MIAFMFIFKILFCSVFHPFGFVKFAVGRGPRGWSAGGRGGSSARAMRSEYKGPRWRECRGPGWRECREPRLLEVYRGPVSKGTGCPGGCSAGGSGGIGMLYGVGHKWP